MSLGDFLANEDKPRKGRTSRKCSICQNPKLADEVGEYVAGRLDGTIAHSVNYMWDRYFGPEWHVGSVNTLRNHIRQHLGEDL